MTDANARHAKALARFAVLSAYSAQDSFAKGAVDAASTDPEVQALNALYAKAKSLAAAVPAAQAAYDAANADYQQKLVAYNDAQAEADQAYTEYAAAKAVYDQAVAQREAEEQAAREAEQAQQRAAAQKAAAPADGFVSVAYADEAEGASTAHAASATPQTGDELPGALPLAALGAFGALMAGRRQLSRAKHARR